MNETLCTELPQIRAQKKVTQEQLALTIGVTRQTIIAIEKGHYTPSLVLALKIAKFFDTQVEKIFALKQIC